MDTIKKIWENLDNVQRLSVVSLLLILFTLPLTIIASLGTTLLFPKASVELSSTVDCIPVDNVIYMVPEGEGGCSDFQKAINNIDGEGYKIAVGPGDYYIPESGDTFSLVIDGKENLTITGNQVMPSHIKSAKLHFDDNDGGINIKNSSNITLKWLEVTGETINGLVYATDNDSISLLYSNFSDNGANTIVLQNSNNSNLENLRVDSFATAIYLRDSRDMEVLNNQITNSRTGIIANEVVNLGIDYNLIDGNVRAFSVYRPGFTMFRNTVVNSLGETQYQSAIYISADENEEPGQLGFVMEKNIVAFNTAGIHLTNAEEISYTFSKNDFFNGDPVNNYIGIPSQISEYGDISADPLFGDDYCLEEGSPAIFMEGGMQMVYMGHRGWCGLPPTMPPTPSPMITPTPIVTPTPVATGLPERCVDNDGGKNYYVKSAAMGITDTQGFISDIDSCQIRDNNTQELIQIESCLEDCYVREFFCSDDLTRLNWVNFECVYGCRDGACLSSPVISPTSTTVTYPGGCDNPSMYN